MLRRDVVPGVHMLDHAYVNFFLLEEDGRVTVVDCAHPRSWHVFVEGLRDTGRSLRDVEAIVLTHGHFDHVGFAERARRELGVPVHAPAQDEHVVRHPWDYRHENSRVPYALRHPGFVRNFTVMGAAGALWVKGVEELRTYGDGDELPVPGRPRAIATPGHTFGHCALHLPDRDAVIAGDALVTYDPYTDTSGPQIIAGAATADSGRALASLDALAATGATTVLPGHGDPWTGGVAAAVEQARATGPS